MGETGKIKKEVLGILHNRIHWLEKFLSDLKECEEQISSAQDITELVFVLTRIVDVAEDLAAEAVELHNVGFYEGIVSYLIGEFEDGKESEAEGI